MEGKVAVLGSADFVMPFSALGVETFAVGDSQEQIDTAAEKIIKEHYALTVVAENIAAKAQQALSVTEKKSIPCVVIVPFTTESEGFATEALAKVLKMATGISILQSD